VDQLEAAVERILREAEGDPEGRWKLCGDGLIQEVSSELGISRRNLEDRLAELGVFSRRYERNLPSLGPEGQRRLFSAHVAVVGCGGLGGTVAELLARAGVGRFTLVDPECFEESNLNRQLVCTPARLGQPKAAATAERLQEVNPAVCCQVACEALIADNAQELLQGADVAVDSLDSAAARLVLEEACHQLQIPLIHAALAGHLGRVMTVMPGDWTVRRLYAQHDQYTAEAQRFDALQSPTVTPAVLAALQAAEVIKVLTGRGDLLQGRALVVDLERGAAGVFPLRLLQWGSALRRLLGRSAGRAESPRAGGGRGERT